MTVLCVICKQGPCICPPSSDVDDDFDDDPGFEDYIEIDPMMGEAPIGIVGPGMRGMSDQDAARYARRRLALQFLLVAYRRSGDIDKDQIGEAFDAAEDFLKQLNERTSQ